MKVRTGKKTEFYRTVWLDGSTLKMINQTLLPHRFGIYASLDYRHTAEAIKNMVVRGAPAIGATGAFGMAQAALGFSGSNMDAFGKNMKAAEKVLSSTRPTAYDLFHGIKTVMDGIKGAKDVTQAKK